MAQFDEQFDKGLVTSRDASLLSQGEMVQCDEAHYRPNDSSIAPVRGRADIVSSSGQYMGVEYLQFDGVIDRLLYAQSINLKTVNITGGGSTEHADGRAVARFTTVHYDNQYLVGNGVDPQLIFTTGMATAAVTSTAGIFPMGIEVSTGAGILSAYFIGLGHADYITAWSPLTYPGAPESGFGNSDAFQSFGYWVTEVVTALNMESAATAIRFPHQASGAGASVLGAFEDQSRNIKIKLPATLTNTIAGKRNIYRSLPVTWGDFVGAGLTQGSPDRFTATGGGNFSLLGDLITSLAASTTSFVDRGNTTGQVFALITADVLGITQSFPRDTKPPTWDVGEVFEDSMVTNDVNNKHIITYSFPGKPWAFPGLYFVPFQTKQRDEVTCIAKLGDILVCGMKNNIFRVNFLPRENDGDFARGRAFEEISSDTGCQSKDGFTTFSSEGSGPKLAFIARDNLWITDGYSLQEATRDIDWEATVEQSLLSQAVLINVPHLWLLIMYYTPLGGSTNTRALYFHYHPQHLKDGRMKVTGPVTQRRPDGTTTNTPSTNAAAYGNNTLFYGDTESSDGRIGTEDQDLTTTPTMHIRSRLVYPRDLDSEVELQRLYLLSKTMPTAPASVTNKVQWAARMADDTALTTSTPAESFVSGILDRIPMDFFAEAFQLRVSASGPLTYWSVKLDAQETK